MTAFSPATGTDPDRTLPERDAVRASGNALAPGTRIGDYELVRVIGEGGFGIVYLAWDHALQRQVAIKEYMPASLAQRTRELDVSVRSQGDAELFAAGLKSFVNEARLLAKFDHPSLLKVHRFWEAHGTACMVMPYVGGRTLGQTLAARKAAPDETFLLELLDALLDALGTLHRANCYHRDVAPDNIMILDDGRPLLLDFGAARRVIGDLTSALTVILKPGYAPVEQYGEMSELAQGPWTDLYALGAVAYFAIVGHKPPPALQRFLDDKLEPLARSHAGRYSARLLNAIDAALRVHARERPQSVEEMRELLGLARGGMRALASGTGAPPREQAAAAATAVRRHTVRVAGALSATAIAIAAGMYAFGKWLPSPTSRIGLGSAPSPTVVTGAREAAAQPANEAEPTLPRQSGDRDLTVPRDAGDREPTAPRDAGDRAPPVRPPTAEGEAPASLEPPRATAGPALEPAAGPSEHQVDAAAQPLPSTALPPASREPARPTARAGESAAVPPSAGTERRRPDAMTATPPRIAAPARRIPNRTDAPERCIDIIRRASLGEPLEPDEAKFLKQECGR